MRTRSSARGFTLVELLITMAVVAIVLAGTVVVLQSQRKAYIDGQRLRAAQTSARRALLALEQALPSAGFGMDPALAFDLQGWTTGPCPGPMGTCSADSTSNSDEITFFARDPRYWVPSSTNDLPVGNAWQIVSVAEGVVTINARGDELPFAQGQILLGVCSSSASYAYFTVSTNTPIPGAGSQQIPLLASLSTNPFQREDVAAGLDCFNSALAATPARLFLVNKYRFHVRPVAIGTMGSATLYDPLLVLDRGIDANGDGVIDENDEQLIAEGIESLQVSYGFYAAALPPAAATPGTGITLTPGAASGAGTSADTITTTLFPGAAAPTGATAYQPSSFYGYTYGPPPAAERNTNHQANLQTVRISVLARSTETDVQGSRRADQLLPILNQNALPSWVTGYATALGGHDGYQRIVLDTTVGLPNMATSAMTYF